MTDSGRTDPAWNVLRSAELKRRGIAAIEEALRSGPVHLLKRNQPAAVVLSEDQYQRLRLQAAQVTTPEISALDWLLQKPAALPGRSRQEINADLAAERDW
jgi:PHD/YefM family antitoxin component YafN of YafNO toxin-antitoxin module